MPRYTITTHQSFGVTYDVMAESADGAWDALLDGEGEPVGSQEPGEIIGERESALIVSQPD